MTTDMKPNILSGIGNIIKAFTKPVEIDVKKGNEGFIYHVSGFDEKLVFKHLRNLLDEFLGSVENKSINNNGNN